MPLYYRSRIAISSICRPDWTMTWILASIWIDQTCYTLEAKSYGPSSAPSLISAKLRRRFWLWLSECDVHKLWAPSAFSLFARWISGSFWLLFSWATFSESLCRTWLASSNHSTIWAPSTWYSFCAKQSLSGIVPSTCNSCQWHQSKPPIPISTYAIAFCLLLSPSSPLIISAYSWGLRNLASEALGCSSRNWGIFTD